MARIRDIPTVLRKAGPWQFAKKVYWRINDDNLFTWASALAYSWLFAVFPFFLVLMTLLPYLPERYKTGVKDQIQELIYRIPNDPNDPADAADTLWTNIEPRLNQVLNEPPKGFFSIGLILTLWAASGGMAMTMAAMDRCYDVKVSRPYWKQRPLAILMTIVVATFILMVLILIPVGSLVTNWAFRQFVDAISMPLLVLWQIARYGLSFVLLFGVLSIIYYFGPNVRQRYHPVTPGAVFSVVIWLLLGFAFSQYILRFGKYNETYGTVGGVAVLLLFFYIDALVLLIGAEINCEMDATLAGVDRCSEERRAKAGLPDPAPKPPEVPTPPTTP
jgi:membrane protein